MQPRRALGKRMFNNAVDYNEDPGHRSGDRKMKVGNADHVILGRCGSPGDLAALHFSDERVAIRGDLAGGQLYMNRCASPISHLRTVGPTDGNPHHIMLGGMAVTFVGDNESTESVMTPGLAAATNEWGGKDRNFISPYESSLPRTWPHLTRRHYSESRSPMS